MCARVFNVSLKQNKQTKFRFPKFREKAWESSNSSPETFDFINFCFRDAVKVTDISSMIQLMRYNNFTRVGRLIDALVTLID